MYKILKKEEIANNITKMVIDAPLIAKKAQSGQFLVLRTHEKGERFPLTIADFDREAGTVTIIFAQIGKSTQYLGTLPEGGEILDAVSYTHLDVYKRQFCANRSYLQLVTPADIQCFQERQEKRPV